MKAYKNYIESVPGIRYRKKNYEIHSIENKLLAIFRLPRFS